MGRRPDPDQARKGHPGRRRTKVEKREDEARRVAELLTANAGADISVPPAMLDQGPLYADAVAVWHMLAPRLARTHRLSEQHKPIFAMFCVYYADWVRLNDLLKREGETQSVKTVAGGVMIRDHPAIRQRERCFENVMKLSAQFGLTPHDEYDLFKNQALAAAQNPGLFGTTPQAKSEEAGRAGPAPGMLGAMNSEPPSKAVN